MASIIKGASLRNKDKKRNPKIKFRHSVAFQLISCLNMVLIRYTIFLCQYYITDGLNSDENVSCSNHLTETHTHSLSNELHHFHFFQSQIMMIFKFRLEIPFTGHHALSIVTSLGKLQSRFHSFFKK